MVRKLFFVTLGFLLGGVVWYVIAMFLQPIPPISSMLTPPPAPWSSPAYAGFWESLLVAFGAIATAVAGAMIGATLANHRTARDGVRPTFYGTAALFASILFVVFGFSGFGLTLAYPPSDIVLVIWAFAIILSFRKERGKRIQFTFSLTGLVLMLVVLLADFITGLDVGIMPLIAHFLF